MGKTTEKNREVGTDISVLFCVKQSKIGRIYASLPSRIQNNFLYRFYKID